MRDAGACVREVFEPLQKAGDVAMAAAGEVLERHVVLQKDAKVWRSRYRGWRTLRTGRPEVRERASLLR